MLARFFCALLAPAGAHAAAVQWAMPEPTHFAPQPDNWSPAPTAAPRFAASDLFRRQTTDGGGNTCAFLSGSSESSITCANTDFICATNTQYGIAGCCNPASMSACVLPTSCVASTAIPASCSNGGCSKDPQVTTCSQWGATECYQWRIAYPKTVMTQFGCTDKGFTKTAQRSWQMSTSSVTPEVQTVTVAVTPTPTPTLSPSQPSDSKPSLGAIIGGTIGGCIFLSGIAFAFFMVYRKRKNQEDLIRQKSITRFLPGGSMTEYDPQGFPSTYVANDHKVWSLQGPVQRNDNLMPQYPGMAAGHYGVLEVDGQQQPVEAPAERGIYEAK